MSQRSVNGTPATYTANDLNEVTADGVNTYAYDVNGNRTNKTWSGASQTFAYDDENRLIHIEAKALPGGHGPQGPLAPGDQVKTWAVDFIYDGLGRLRKKNESNWDSTHNNW